MLNYSELRKEFKGHRHVLGLNQYNTTDKQAFSAYVMGICFILAMIILICGDVAHAENAGNPGNFTLNDKTAVLALIGEAEGESQTCRIAIAETIRKRGSLKGIYGVHAKRVKEHKYSDKSFTLARAAWWDSQHTNYSKDADGWGNKSDLVKFKKCSWFKGCEVVVQIDGTYFWKRRV